MLSLAARFVLFGMLVLCLLLGLSTESRATGPVTHPAFEMYSAYQGDAEGNARVWRGHLEPLSGTAAYAGVLKISPGDRWANYIGAAQAGVSYSIKAVRLIKEAPAAPGCPEAFPGTSITQEGSPNIRLNWPLDLEAPGTTWTLVISYMTPTPWDDDDQGPNPAGYFHTEVWTWTLAADTAHLIQEMILLHDKAFGKSMVPLVCDEDLYLPLLQKLTGALSAEAQQDYVQAEALLEDFREQVCQAEISTAPGSPNPSGTGTGIAGTEENPAACKLMADVDYILIHPPYANGLQSVPVTKPLPQTAPTDRPIVLVSRPTTHLTEPVYTAVPGNSAGNPVEYRGYGGVASGAVTFPGVLGISTGANWSNFVQAAQEGVAYTLGDVTLGVETPELSICRDVFPQKTFTQGGTDDIRTWWPLMYQPAGTTWRLTINYTTPMPWDEDGPDGPQLPSLDHSEVWEWELQPNLDTISSELELFHSLPSGTCEVPLISDETLYPLLQSDVSTAVMALSSGDMNTAAAMLAAIEWSADGSAIAMCPAFPNPAGPGTGIAQTSENPAAAKIMTDVHYVRFACGATAPTGLGPGSGNLPIQHPVSELISVGWGDLAGTPRVFAGHDPSQSGGAAYPGTLTIVPGTDWSNFIGASNAGVPYSLAGDSVALSMSTPYTIQCAETFLHYTITQTGTPNIRLHWPLVYNAPGTQWRLTVLYETPTPWDDDGPGPNAPSYLHLESWSWELRADIQSLKGRLSLFHDVPAGTSETPLISDEALYSTLMTRLDQTQAAIDNYDPVTAGLVLGDFEMNVMDNCIAALPPAPVIGGPGTGILNTEENPACCSLLADAEFLGFDFNICCASPAPKTSTRIVQTSSDGSIEHPLVTLSPATLGGGGATPTAYLGYNGTQTGIVPFPGVFGLAPGENWSNFIASDEAVISYTLDEVILMKESPMISECSDLYPSHNVTQCGADTIRLWWPLLYESPGTTFTLTLDYQTNTPEQFQGESEPSIHHTETWEWEVGSTLAGLPALVDAFRALPFGLDNVPLISDEALYHRFASDLDEAAELMAGGDPLGANTLISGLMTSTADSCITMSPMLPNPTGPGTGIAGTNENPACCVLWASLEDLFDWTTYGSATEMSTSADDGEPVTLVGPMVVTLLGDGWLYMQDTGRCAGIRVIGDVAGTALGARVGVQGIVDTEGPERVIRMPTLQIIEPSGTLPGALGMPIRSVGGAGKGFLPGFPGVFGLWNGGLRVMVAGKVTAIDDGCLLVDDGSECQNGTENRGVRIVIPEGVTPPGIDSCVRAVGVSSWFDCDGTAYPAVIAGSGDDVTVLTEIP